MTLDEFLDGNYEHSELFGGEVRPKPVPGWLHGRMELRLGRLLGDIFGEDRVATEVNLRIGEDSPMPDVIVCSRDEPDLYRGTVDEPPLLCVEVVSPSQTPEEMCAKCLRYRRFGVPYCWVVDPETRRAWEMSPTGAFTEVLEDFLTPQPIPLSALFD
jgi:Uma2 family endonuclease